MIESVQWEWVTLLAAGLAVLAASGAVMAADPPEQRLWAGDAPGSEGVKNTERSEGARTYDVTVPTLTVYRAPKDTTTGTAIVVCPGGAFRRLATAHEGHDVAKWLNSLGVTAAVLKYRVGKQIKSSADVERLSVADGMRAIRTLRAKAAALGVRPDRVGIMGFSAGGNLAGRLVARMNELDADAADPIDRLSCRPDFAVLVYASIRTLDERTVTRKTPPIFMIHAANDRVPNDGCAKLFLALYKAKVPAELHIFTTGGHGFGLGNRGGAVAAWPKLFALWLSESEKFQNTFRPDYLAPIGGQAKAVLTPGATVAYKDLHGDKQVATARAVRANKDGVVASAWRRETLGRRIGYAFCYLRSDTDQQVRCHFGSDDEARVWINGKLVCENDAPRELRARDDSFDVRLTKGLNPVMVKASQRSGTWAFKLEAPARPPAAQPAAPPGAPVNDLREDGVVPNWVTLTLHIEKLNP